MSHATPDDRCHGTVIIHAGWGAECTEPDCDGLEPAHAYRIDCDAIDCHCADATRLAI